MKKYVLYLIITLLTVANGCKCGSKSSSSDVVSPSVTTPEISVVTAGDPIHPSDFTLTIDITGAVNTAGIYFTLNYDPKIIQIKNVNNPANSVTKGAFFDQEGVVTGLGIGFYQNLDSSFSDSSLVVGLARAGGNPGINGSGTIMTFTLTTVSAGSTSVNFGEAADNSLVTPELVSISGVKWTNREVTVK